MQPKNTSMQRAQPPTRPSLPHSLEVALGDLVRIIHEGLLPQAEVSLRRRPRNLPQK